MSSNHTNKNNNINSQASTPRRTNTAEANLDANILPPSTMINSNEANRTKATETLRKHEQNFIRQIKNRGSKHVAISPTYRKAIVEINGKEEVHFQCYENGEWKPCDSFYHSHNNYSENTRAFTPYKPVPDMTGSTILNTRSVKGGKRIKKASHVTQKKRVRVCFSKKGKKTRCKYMKLSLPKRRV